MSKKSPNLVSLDHHRCARERTRRAQRALLFFANILGGGPPQDVTGLTAPLPGIKHLPAMGFDIAVTRDPAPAHMKGVIQHARARQVGFLLVRFRDPAPGIAEALVEAVLVEGAGIAILEQLSAVSPDGRNWTLVGPHAGGVNLRVEKGELVPTLSVPWPRDEDRHRFVSRGDQMFADFIWRS